MWESGIGAGREHISVAGRGSSCAPEADPIRVLSVCRCAGWSTWISRLSAPLWRKETVKASTIWKRLDQIVWVQVVDTLSKSGRPVARQSVVNRALITL